MEYMLLYWIRGESGRDGCVFNSYGENESFHILALLMSQTAALSTGTIYVMAQFDRNN